MSLKSKPAVSFKLYKIPQKFIQKHSKTHTSVDVVEYLMSEGYTITFSHNHKTGKLRVKDIPCSEFRKIECKLPVPASQKKKKGNRYSFHLSK